MNLNKILPFYYKPFSQNQLPLYKQQELVSGWDRLSTLDVGNKPDLEVSDAPPFGLQLAHYYFFNL